LIYLKEGGLNMQFIQKIIIVIVAFFALLLISLNSNAQELVVAAKLDTNQILIGKQTRIRLTATAQKGVNVIFPDFKDTIIEKVELVSAGKIDTALAGNQATYQRDLIITSFDSGFFAIPPFKFKIKNDTSKVFETEALLFTVQTIPVDTTLAIKAIKGPIDPAWSIYEIQKELLIGLIALLAIIVLIYFLKRKKKIEVVEVVAVNKRPAHEIAIEALNDLRVQKLWQQGRVKEYHIVISDTVRTYIENRFNVSAMEMTSDEILKSLRFIITDVNLKSKLSNVLVLSDMVKFAKEQPLPNENELSWENAIDFVKHTALVEQEEEEKP
jgi:hypothetical protein